MAIAAGRCSARSEARDEPLAGTASTVRRWILLEHDGPWGERPLLDARLPRGLTADLRALERTHRIRVLLIRRPDRDVAEGGAAFAIRSGPGEAWIESARLTDPRDVLSLDLDALASGRSLGLERREAPLFVVCTHGRHDPCCAERGRPLAQWLSVARPEETWESTHVGGDRFAANVVAFPHGWYFGRVDHDAGRSLAEAYLRGRIDLEHARGRSSESVDVQVAELAVRRDAGLDRLDDVEKTSVRRDAGRSTVGIDTRRAGSFVVVVDRTWQPPMRLTCHALEEGSPPAFEVVSIRRA
jgi:hypothetical protein